MDPKDRKDITTGTSNPTPTGTAATRARVLDSSGSPLKGETIAGEKKVPNVVEKVSDVASGIVNKVSESIDYDKIRDTAGDYYKKSIEYSKQKPGLALGISLGVGVLLGYLLAPKKPSYYRTVNCVTKDVTTLLLDRLF
jgi:ElaB/YqjD/DUF883 family membrane-anchored ribosome-binding protein